MPRRKATKIKRSNAYTTELSASALKNVLWETLQDLRVEEVDPKTANAVAAQARTIASIVKIQLQVAKMSGKSPNATTVKFIR
jgi:hypothetical protein